MYEATRPGTTTTLKEVIVFFAGIDWADDHHDIAVLTNRAIWSIPPGWPIPQLAWPNSRLSS